MEATEATALINGLIKEIDSVRRDPNHVDAWRRKCRTVLDAIFGNESSQSNDLMAISFSFRGTIAGAIGDNGPHIRAFQNGLDKSEEMLRSFIWEIEQFGVRTAASSNDPAEAFAMVEMICNRFHAVTQQIRRRYSNRQTLDVADEYDVQDLLHALLKLHFDDIRPEEWTPSYASGSARMDFLLKREQVVIETKKTRIGLDARKIGDDLLLDIARYKVHPDCKTLICFVYDPENLIANPVGLENDLARQDGELTVKVIIAPKI